MRIEIAPLACAGQDALRPLLMLLSAFTEDRHEWAADEASIAALTDFFEKHAPLLAPNLTTLGQKAIVGAVWSAGSPAAGAAQVLRVTAADLPGLADDLHRAAVLLVEDMVTDGAFVRAVAAVFGHRRILEALDNRWLELRHAGGAGRFDALVDAEQKGFRVVARIAVLADSDRWVPKQRMPIHDKADRFRAMGLAVHVLELREAENYLPNRVLAGCGDRIAASSTLSALKRLTPAQRGHYDMKKGFGKRTEPVNIRPEQRSLYSSVDAKTLGALRGGFGDGLLIAFEQHGEALSVADIRSLGAHVEADLRALLSTIESVI